MCPVSYNIKSTRQKLDGTLKNLSLFFYFVIRDARSKKL